MKSTFPIDDNIKTLTGMFARNFSSESFRKTIRQKHRRFYLIFYIEIDVHSMMMNARESIQHKNNGKKSQENISSMLFDIRSIQMLEKGSY